MGYDIPHDRATLEYQYPSDCFTWRWPDRELHVYFNEVWNRSSCILLVLVYLIDLASVQLAVTTLFRESIWCHLYKICIVHVSFHFMRQISLKQKNCLKHQIKAQALPLYLCFTNKSLFQGALFLFFAGRIEEVRGNISEVRGNIYMYLTEFFAILIYNLLDELARVAFLLSYSILWCHVII